MNVLVACEESQEVCKAFRAKGHNAFSCDLVQCSGGKPHWHIQGNALDYLIPREGRYDSDTAIYFLTQDGYYQSVPKWDILIVHPPCTYLTVTGNRWFNTERYGEKAIERMRQRELAIDFFLAFAFADIPKICIENPIGCMSSQYRKPDQIIQPYQFGHPMRKATCLWLKGLPKLQPTEIVEPDIYYYTAANGRIKSDSRYRSQGKKSEWARQRSKTFPGIARAMAEQWG